jgi:putative transposase
VKRQWIEAHHPGISQRRQCQLLGVSRSGWYYQPQPESRQSLHLMRLLDEQYTRTPFYGIRRMTVCLRQQGEAVNHKRVARLMRVMGLEAIYPKPRLSEAVAGHRIFPYLLRNVTITRPNQVWSTDITYIRLSEGFVYLMAILDWYSRYVVAWEVSVSLERSFCVTALEWALRTTRPEIFNSDQGAQFTSPEFTDRLQAHDIAISMDGRGRALDNIFVERLWRTVKYEEVYLKDYATVREAVTSLSAYFRFYNHERPHQSLGYRTPAAVYAEVAASGKRM